ncbi:MAG TPA: protein kinase [Kofleriaceae bacterium]|nr:protein kinase [Kofleriaceae bacterium]
MERDDDPPTLKSMGSAPDTLVKTTPHPKQSVGDVEDVTKSLDGYAFGAVIGRGGVGEVVAAHDLRMGRDVAIKRLRTTSPSADEVNRFLREARIQARLDHPAIPPVHELGAGPDGKPFFTMKKLVGQTLSELLAAPEPNRPRLLRAFVEVCQALDFAHARGVVHRDLKPGNIMLGDYGDVYVLDWGLARVVGEAITEVVTDDIDSLDLKSGDILGTPGYMAPEQLQRVGDTGRPADIYALGSILFELLAGEPLHPRGPTAIASTVGNEAVTSAAKRRPDRAVPPELDAICVAMLTVDPTTRPTARRVADRVQAYLDGDRDVARRKTMAVDLVWSARAQMNEGNRADAMRAAGRALALDPESTGAAELVTALMLEPPKEPPAELKMALRDAEDTGVRRHARTAILAYLAIASFLPIAMWNGIRKWDVVLAVFVVAIVMAAGAFHIMRRGQPSNAFMMLYAFGNALLLGVLTRLAGPFTFVPALSCVVIMSVMAYPLFTVRSWVLIVMIAGGFMVTIALELNGMLPMTWEIQEGVLISHAGALSLRGDPTLALLISSTVATIVIAGIHAARIYRAGRDARLQLVTQAWHLRQLLPKTA